MTIETKALVISEELRKKVDMICRFANVKYNLLMAAILVLNLLILLIQNHIF